MLKSACDAHIELFM